MFANYGYYSENPYAYQGYVTGGPALYRSGTPPDSNAQYADYNNAHYVDYRSASPERQHQRNHSPDRKKRERDLRRSRTTHRDYDA